MAVPSILARLPLFDGLTDDELAMLKDYLKTRRLAPGETLFCEGDRATDCFIVLDGLVGVYRNLGSGKREKLASLGSGAMVGHVALIDGKPRSATCRAEDKPVFLIVLPRDIFEKLFNAKSPLAFKILDKIAMDLAKRLRRATSKLAAVKAKDMASRSPDARKRAIEAAYELIQSRVTQLDISCAELDEISFEIPEGQA